MTEETEGDALNMFVMLLLIVLGILGVASGVLILIFLAKG